MEDFLATQIFINITHDTLNEEIMLKYIGCDIDLDVFFRNILWFLVVICIISIKVSWAWSKNLYSGCVAEHLFIAKQYSVSISCIVSHINIVLWDVIWEKNEGKYM